jgi:hypothetical protein
MRYLVPGAYTLRTCYGLIASLHHEQEVADHETPYEDHKGLASNSQGLKQKLRA